MAPSTSRSSEQTPDLSTENESPLARLAVSLGRRDERPNVALAEHLSATGNAAAVGEIVTNLSNPSRAVRADCIKVIYEVGARVPALVVPHLATIGRLLGGPDNRLVWGAATAFAATASAAPDAVFRHRASLEQALHTGTVITQDNAFRALATVAAAGPRFHRALFPVLIGHLRRCRPKDVPSRAEALAPAANSGSGRTLLDILRRRLPELSHAQGRRVRRVMASLVE